MIERIFGMKLILKSDKLIVFLLWLILTVFNFNKAYHIDDTFHLEAAKWIVDNPLHPMSGLINWGDFPTAMYTHNQPPLFFYIIALTYMLFGDSEIVMHLLISAFSFFSLFYFYKLLRYFKIVDVKFLLTVFAFSPALIINQNLMTDVPLLSVVLAMSYYLLQAKNSNSWKRYLLVASLFSIGVLIKYSMFPLIIPLIYVLIISSEKKYFLTLLFPLTILISWTFFNFYEFGESHIFGRKSSHFEISRVFGFLATLGSVVVFGISYLRYLFSELMVKFFIVISLLLFSSIGLSLYYGSILEAGVDSIMFTVFLSFGISIVCFLMFEFKKKLKFTGRLYFKSDDFLLLLVISSFGVFFTFFAPFMALRHILLILPFILLFSRSSFQKSKGFINIAIVTLTISIGCLLGVSDWYYADFYRKSANELMLGNKNIWSVGHWGWQWYSEKNGMITYSLKDSKQVVKGDFFVIPKNIAGQQIDSLIELKEIRILTQDPNFSTFFSGKNSASMYSCGYGKPAWSLSMNPIDTVAIYEVVNIAN